MKIRNRIIFYFVILFCVYFGAFKNFFLQDDFVLIEKFSQNGFSQNLRSAFEFSEDTHWRPVHNLFFLISGSLFFRHYFLYHLVVFGFHIASVIFIYKLLFKLYKDEASARMASILYLVSPVHFVSLYWISGGATIIGITFLVVSFYAFLLKKPIFTVGFFILSILSSEAMIMGLFIFPTLAIAYEKSLLRSKVLLILVSVAAIFIFLKFTVLRIPVSSIDYQLELSLKTLGAVKYYFLRILGYAEGSGFSLNSLLLTGWLIAVFRLMFLKRAFLSKKKHVLLLAFCFLVFGLFPFVLMPNHLSAHYMNISLIGFTTLLGLAFYRRDIIICSLVVFLYVIISLFNLKFYEENHWAVKRGELARYYIDKISGENPKNGSMLVFSDNFVSSSLEAYFSLGTGKAVDFWFKDMNYKYCFSAFESCQK